MNREFLQLAQNYQEDRHHIAGWYASEKLDGMRCFWEPTSRGRPAGEPPWSNDRNGKSTGLWSRYGNVIHAPDYFLDALPKLTLDGELWLGRGSFQDLISIVKRKEPDDRWKDVRFLVFESPDPFRVFLDGRINNPNFKKEINGHQCLEYLGPVKSLGQGFNDNYHNLGSYTNKVVERVQQTRLSMHTEKALEQLDQMLDKTVAAGGEGIMLRHPQSAWYPKRVAHLLKVKPYNDAEGVVVGWTPGVGKLKGMMGSLRIKFNGIVFDLSGFTDRERTLKDNELVHFKLGQQITFRYRELTKDGIPKEARYWRK